MSEEKIIQLIKKLTQEISPSHYFRVSTKEKIMSRIDKKIYSPWLSWASFQKGIAGALVFALLFFVISPLFTPTVSAYIGEAIVKQGHVTITKNDGTKTIKDVVKLSIGDIITVGNESIAELSFIDKSKSTLTSGTVVKVSDAIINSTNVHNSIIRVRLEHGKMTNVVVKEDILAEMQIETPTSMIQANNSEFTVEVDDKGSTEVMAFTNSVKVKAVSSVKNTDHKVLAETNASIGQKIKIKSDIDEKQPLEILHETNNGNSNINASPVPETNNNNQNATKKNSLPLLESNFDIAQVKLYQSIDFVSQKEFDKAADALRDYQLKLSQIMNQIFEIEYENAFSSLSLLELLKKSVTQDLIQKVSELEDDQIKALVLKYSKVFVTLEAGLQQKLTKLDDPVSDPVIPGINNNSDVSLAHTTIVYNIAKIKQLTALKAGLSDKEQEDIQNIIAQEVEFIANYINSLSDWKEQQKVMEEILAIFPDSIQYKEALLVLRQKASERISFLINRKINELR